MKKIDISMNSQGEGVTDAVSYLINLLRNDLQVNRFHKYDYFNAMKIVLLNSYNDQDEIYDISYVRSNGGYTKKIDGVTSYSISTCVDFLTSIGFLTSYISKGKDKNSNFKATNEFCCFIYDYIGV